ncbi:MAG: hypothetical protein ACFE8B_16815 [Candidatus Hermodarchaeota archaeon]
MTAQIKKFNLIVVILGLVLMILGIILTFFYVYEMGKRTIICSCYIIDNSLFYSILVNIGIGLILFGLNNILISLRKYIKSFIMIILGIILIVFFLIIILGYLNIDFDIRLNFIPYLISGILLIVGGVIFICKERTEKKRISNLGMKLSLIGGIILIIIDLIFNSFFYFGRFIYFPIIMFFSIIIVYVGLRYEKKESIACILGGITAVLITYIISLINSYLWYYTFLHLIGGLIVIGSITELKFRKVGTITCLITLVCFTIFFSPIIFYSYIYLFPYLPVLLGIIISIKEIFQEKKSD